MIFSNPAHPGGVLHVGESDEDDATNASSLLYLYMCHVSNLKQKQTKDQKNVEILKQAP